LALEFDHRLMSNRAPTGDFMKAYLITTGSVFGLIVVMHIARLVAEGPQLATNPFFILSTIAAIALCFWACRLFRLSSRS
jgi:hypothetical protein